jgi:hypothetical protein
MIDENPCPVTGMWRVQPEMCGDQRVMSVIHVDSIMRGVHCPTLLVEFLKQKLQHEVQEIVQSCYG